MDLSGLTRGRVMSYGELRVSIRDHMNATNKGINRCMEGSNSIFKTTLMSFGVA
jgi:hypothetical protein